MSDIDEYDDDLETCINCGKPSKRDRSDGSHLGLCEKHYRDAHKVGLADVTDSPAGPHHLMQEHSLHR